MQSMFTSVILRLSTKEIESVHTYAATHMYYVMDQHFQRESKQILGGCRVTCRILLDHVVQLTYTFSSMDLECM